ncbi:plasmid mobilization protein [Aquibium microcysteis]|uniref:plasmid mobilization protein n=1 Tax=Aquibium microcysteis TaxID=675281 RepID=UPI00165D0F66|nr:ribbon-helix-helix protein, CopG family [Aquibium microcysteis]
MDIRQRKENKLFVRVSDDDKRRLRSAARQRGQTLSAFMREAATMVATTDGRG